LVSKTIYTHKNRNIFGSSKKFLEKFQNISYGVAIKRLLQQQRLLPQG
jgi:hypothetical protein